MCCKTVGARVASPAGLLHLLLPLLLRACCARADEARAERLARVAPFDALAHLPPSGARDDLPTRLEPGLGPVLQLSTYMWPKSSARMATTFHIYRRDKFTRNIQFHARDPAAAAAVQGEPRALNPTQDFQYNLESLLESGFDVTRKTVVMIPGYMSDHEEQWAREAMQSWLELHGDDVNVIVLSWADSNKCIYSQAVATTVVVARQVTVLLHYLAQLGGTHLRAQRFLDSLHLVGHSLGAHISGFVGQDLGGRLGRITGLDPAGPTFDSFPVSHRLDRSDAKLVEVLHTNAGRMHYMKAIAGSLMRAISTSLPSVSGGESAPDSAGSGGGGGGADGQRASDSTAWFGIDQQVGHVDYYANNGRTQEGCAGSLHICDHGRAGEIYVDMLKYMAGLAAAAAAAAEPPQDAPSGVQRAPVAALTKLDRLWAFRAASYEAFQGGAAFFGLCPELVEPGAHLSGAQVSRSFGRCAAPLMDFMTPVDELIGELRDNFFVNFDPEAVPDAQPRFYFRTQPGPPAWPHLVADHYLLKVHLDPERTHWDPAVCALTAALYMDSGDRVSLELGRLDRARSLLAPPFAHPRGPRAHVQLREIAGLLGELPTERANSSLAADGHFGRLFSALFPRTISLGFATLPQSAQAATGRAPACTLGVKLVEVQPVSAYTKRNLGALYGGRPLLPGRQLELVDAAEIGQRLREAETTILEFGNMNSFGVSLESAVVRILP